MPLELVQNGDAQPQWNERRLGRTVLKTYRTTLDIDQLLPNDKQPRLGPKKDEELQRQIEANEGIFEPLLVEPHPELLGKFRIIDGRPTLDECESLSRRLQEESISTDPCRSYRSTAY